jgi:hypothetical protein
MKPSVISKLDRADEETAPAPKWHILFQWSDETDEERALQIRAMKDSGRAKEGDHFFVFEWQAADASSNAK